MCELFGVAGSHPTTITFSLEEFARHGGETGPHRDGWGVAFLEDGDARIFREPRPSSESACVRYLETHETRARLVISHIRNATRGRPRLRNTHPFDRELGGRRHVFAHNGTLEGVREAWALWPSGAQPIGQTDSEHAFCHLLTRLRPLWLPAGPVPSLPARARVFYEFARAARALGPANFLYSDGDALFAAADRRHQRDGTVRPPGLHLLRRARTSPRGALAAGIRMGGGPEEARVVLLASVPLTEEPWEPLEVGTVVVVRDGRVFRYEPEEGLVPVAPDEEVDLPASGEGAS